MQWLELCSNSLNRDTTIVGNDVNNNHHDEDDDATERTATHTTDLITQKETQFKAKFNE